MVGLKYCSKTLRIVFFLRAYAKHSNLITLNEWNDIHLHSLVVNLVQSYKAGHLVA